MVMTEENQKIKKEEDSHLIFMRKIAQKITSLHTNFLCNQLIQHALKDCKNLTKIRMAGTL